MQKQYKLIKPGSSVLDLGCAPGAWLQVFPFQKQFFFLRGFKGCLCFLFFVLFLLLFMMFCSAFYFVVVGSLPEFGSS